MLRGLPVSGDQIKAPCDSPEAWRGVQVFVRGDMAFITGRSLLEGTQDGRDISSANQYADVYLRRDGKWQAVVARIMGATASASPPSP